MSSRTCASQCVALQPVRLSERPLPSVCRPSADGLASRRPNHPFLTAARSEPIGATEQVPDVPTLGVLSTPRLRSSTVSVESTSGSLQLVRIQSPPLGPGRRRVPPERLAAASGHLLLLPVAVSMAIGAARGCRATGWPPLAVQAVVCRQGLTRGVGRAGPALPSDCRHFPFSLCFCVLASSKNCLLILLGAAFCPRS